MAEKSNIEWTDATWNPIVGCSLASPGCTNCYAMKWAAARLDQPHGQFPHYMGTTKKVNGHAVWSGKIAEAPEHIWMAPLKRKKPTKYFVNSMGDLFHEDVPDEWIDRVFAIMALCPQHTFQVLTKRSKRMRDYCTSLLTPTRLVAAALKTPKGEVFSATWPLRNVWLGVSCEDQKRADERIPDLLATPAAKRFVSAEPLLGPIDLGRLAFDGAHNWIDALLGREYGQGWTRDTLLSRIDWIIAGGESGPGARPMHPDWPRAIRDQCAACDVSFFFKQWGEFSTVYDRDRDDHDWRRCDTVKAQTPRGQWLNLVGGQGFHNDRVVRVDRIGKAKAGNHLDGKQHLEFPK